MGGLDNRLTIPLNPPLRKGHFKYPHPNLLLGENVFTAQDKL